MFKCILVALDGSALAERALDPALELARKSNGQLLVVRVPIPATVSQPSRGNICSKELWSHEVDSQGHEATLRYLDQVRRRISREAVPVRIESIGGDPGKVIAGFAARQVIDLIVMSTHGRAGFSRWLMGNITKKVLRLATVPVLVVRSRGPYREFLIPLDGSERARRALLPGIDAAAGMGDKVTLLRATGVSAGEDREQRQLGLRADRDHKKVSMDQARMYLEKTAEHIQRPDVDIRIAVCHGSPSAAIINWSTSHDVDLIAMATYGRSCLRRVFYGRVIEKVLRSGVASMLIVPSRARKPPHSTVA